MSTVSSNSSVRFSASTARVLPSFDASFVASTTSSMRPALAMIRLLTLVVMSLALALFGCGQSEEPKPKQQIEKAVSVKPAEPAETAAGEAKEATEVVTEKAADVKDHAESAVKETVEETKAIAAAAADETQEVASQANETTKETIAEAQEATSEAVETVVEESKGADIATTAAVGGAVETAQQAVSPKTVVLEASYGKVTFPHILHAEAYDCTTCHGEGPPGTLGLGKEKAHALCKGCHKEVGAGPTGCKDCHVK